MLKRIIKNTLSFILYQYGRIKNIKNINVLSLYFHNPSPESFEDIVIWLVKHNYSFISAEDLLMHMKGELPLTKKSVYISFDDGWQGNLQLVPIIEKYNIPVTIFIATEPLQSGNYWWEFASKTGGQQKVAEFKAYNQDLFYNELNLLKSTNSLCRSSMTVSELVELSKHSLVDIQSHTHTHPILTNLNDQSLDEELQHSQELLCQLIAKPIDKFSYPNGSYRMREKENVKKYYSCAFSTIQSYPQVGGDLYEIPRIALTDDYWSNLAKIVGAWKLLNVYKKIIR